MSEPVDQPWGYRTVSVKDSGGNRWTICAIIEIVSREEMVRRMAAMMKAWPPNVTEQRDRATRWTELLS